MVNNYLFSNLFTRLRFVVGLLTISVFLFSFAINAKQNTDTASAGIQTSVSIIDAFGKILPGGRVTQMRWEWTEPTEALEDSEARPSEPVLRLRIETAIPSAWKLIDFKSNNSPTSVRVLNEPKEEPNILELQLSTNNAAFRYDLEDQRGQRRELNMTVAINVAKPVVLIKPGCSDLDLKLLVQKQAAKHLFVGVHCTAESAGAHNPIIKIRFFRSHDSKWAKLSGDADLSQHESAFGFATEISRPKTQVAYSKKIFSVSTQDLDGNTAQYALFYFPKIDPERLYANAGALLTYTQYTEALNTVSKSQLSPTAKLNVGYRLIPESLDIAFNGYMSLFAAYQNNQQYPQARFYGANARLGYRLPIDLGSTEFMFLGGWYFWGMLVSDNSYGIKRLAGPHFYFTVAHSPAETIGWWAYAKVALISDQFELYSFSNRELSVGFGLELTPNREKPWSMMLELVNSQFALKDASNSMKLLSVSLGIQKPL